MSRNIKTIENLKNISDYVTSKSKNTKIILSTLTIRTDNADLQEKAKNMNTKIKKFAVNNKLLYMDNDNIDETCLSTKKLHLNKMGKSILAKNLQKILLN